MPKWEACTPCALHKNPLVPYQNGLTNDLFFLAQSPGKDEVAARPPRPFQGRAGTLLDKMLPIASISRPDIFIANSLMCWEQKPLKGKDLSTSLECCKGNFELAAEAVKPKLIVVLGAYALKQCLNKDKITSKRGNFYYSEEYNCPIFVTLHPAYMLRQCTEKYPDLPFTDMNMREKEYYQDFQLLGSYIKNGYKMPEIDTSNYRKGTLKELEKVKAAEVLATDYEATDKDLHNPATRPLSISFTIKRGESLVYLLDNDKTIQAVKETLAVPNTKIVAARPFDENLTRLKLNTSMQGKVMDILAMAHLVDENYHAFNLQNVASVYANMKDIKKLARGMRENLGDADESTLIEYNGVDTDATFEAFQTISDYLLRHPRLLNYYNNFVQPVQDMLSELSVYGCPINTKALRRNEEEALNLLEEKRASLIGRLPKRIKKAHAGKLRLTRDNLLRDMIFTSLRCKPDPELVTDVTKVPKANKEHLSQFIHKPWVKDLLEWKALWKVYSSYLKPLWKHIKNNNKIYPTMTLTRTVTGRSSALNPPIQTYPQRSEYARLVKECIIAGEGRTFGARDLGQSELKGMGWFANDVNILKAIRNGIDIHILTASIINNVSIDKVTKLMRYKAKAINFGLIYGMSAKGLMNYTKIEYGVVMTLEEATKIRNKFFSYPDGYYGLPELYARIISSTRKQGYTETLLGRRRRLPGINSLDRKIAAEAERQAINMHGQSFSSDLAFIGMMLFHQEIKKRDMLDRINALWFIHDQVIFSAEDALIDEGLEILGDCMENQSVRYIKEKFGVEVGYPVTSDFKKGKSWDTLKD